MGAWVELLVSRESSLRHSYLERSPNIITLVVFYYVSSQFLVIVFTNVVGKKRCVYISL